MHFHHNYVAIFPYHSQIVKLHLNQKTLCESLALIWTYADLSEPEISSVTASRYMIPRMIIAARSQWR